MSRSCEYTNWDILVRFKDELEKTEIGSYIYKQIVKNKLRFCIMDPNELTKLRSGGGDLERRLHTLLCMDVEDIATNRIPDLIVYDKRRKKCIIIELKLNVTSKKTRTLEKSLRKAIEQVESSIPCCGPFKKVKVLVFPNRDVTNKVIGLIRKYGKEPSDLKIIHSGYDLKRIDP